MEREDKDKYLAIAKLWKEHQGEPGVNILISKELRVSGKDIGKVGRMIEKGVIAYDPEGQPFYTISFEDAERAVKSSKEDTAVAEDTVVDTVKGAIAGESKSQTEQYLILGKAIWQATATFAAKRGISPEELKGMPVHQMVLDALEKSEKYEPLQRRVEGLEGELSMYREEVDPIARAEKGMRILDRVARLVILGDLVGIDLVEGGVTRYYSELFYKYLKGGM